MDKNKRNKSGRIALILVSLMMIGLFTFGIYNVIATGDTIDDRIDITPTIDNVKDYYTTIDKDTSIYLKEDFNDDYGIIELKDKNDNKIIEYSLTKNTAQCLTECSAEGKVILYNDGILFSDKSFINKDNIEQNILSSQYWIMVNEIYEVRIPSEYEETCFKNETCYTTPIKWIFENRTKEVWIEYNYEILKAGNYKWKLTGQKDKNSNIDFIIERDEIKLTEWAWWNGTGGTVTTDGDYTVHTFTTDGNFDVTGSFDVEILVVAGGGQGGSGRGGGGGAGGLLYDAAFTVTAQNYSVTVGAGGNSSTNPGIGESGDNSSFSTMTATGGGAGSLDSNIGLNGGSGGGSGPTAGPTSGTAGQGYDGGSGGTNAGNYPAGGGGGAGSVGGDGSGTATGGNGGSGLSSSITGSAVDYAGGGGGGTYNGGTPGTGTDGGGNGLGYSTATAGAGTVNTGSGGGGSGYIAGTGTGLGGAGGSGIVIIRYLTAMNTCEFKGYVFDGDSVAIEGVNVTVWNQYDVSEYYNDTTDANGYWAYNITNSSNTYMAGAYNNNGTIIGQLKKGISALC